MIDVRPQMTLGVTGRYATDQARIIGVATHHSVSGGQFFTARAMTPDDEINHLRMIDEYHVRIEFGGFAYHMAAFPSGRYYLCGSLGGARAHVASRNDELIGFVLIGDFTAVVPPPAQIAAAAACLAYIRQTYPERPNKGHRDWALPGWSTSCPGDTWRSWLNALEPPPAEEEDIMQEEDRRMLKAVHDWLFDPATFTDPLGRPEWAGATRAQWIEAFAGSMDSVHHTHKSAIEHPDSAFHAIAKAVGATP